MDDTKNPTGTVKTDEEKPDKGTTSDAKEEKEEKEEKDKKEEMPTDNQAGDDDEKDDQDDDKKDDQKEPEEPEEPDADDKKSDTDDANAEIEALKAEIAKLKAEKAIAAKTAEYGFSPVQNGYIAKLVAGEDIMADNGDVDDKKLGAVMDGLKAAFPAIFAKADTSTTGGFKFGAAQTKDDNSGLSDEIKKLYLGKR